MPLSISEIADDLFARLVSRTAIASQSGIISGGNPVDFDSTDPIKLWIVQVGIILIFCGLLSILFAKFRQPKVIAEVIGGVLLGPSVMGHIPNFSNRIFPAASLPYLNLTATIALVLFLFLVGLEIDLSTMNKNLRRAGLISVAGMVLPFGMGAAISLPIYNNFVNHEVVTFGHFLLFTCVAMSITAFPVLARILTELKLLDTTVGVVVLSAGVGNDVVGWILLALTVALVNASSGVVAVYVLLAGVGWTLFLLSPVRIAFRWLARKTGSLETGEPTTFMMLVTFLLVFASAFFTDIIGIHPIFGGFLAGLVIPHEGGFAIAIVEKIEDIVTILLLPIYFALSGLKTNLGTLNTGKSWGYIILLISVAFVGKFIGCAAAAKLSRFNNREAGAIGALMSCKGLVELIVLNIGLSAGILDTRLFSMFVLMAIVLTCVTTPLTLWIYPSHVRVLHSGAIARLAHEEKPGSTSDGSVPEKGDDFITSQPSGTLPDPASPGALGMVSYSKFTVILERIEHLPAIMTVAQLLQSPSAARRSLPHISALRLVELTDRTSAVMRGSEASELLRRDALVKVFEMFGKLNRIVVSSALSVVPQSLYVASVVEHASEAKADLVVLPWTVGSPANAGSTLAASPTLAGIEEEPATTSSNPFSGLFGGANQAVASSTSGVFSPTATGETSVLYSQFIRQAFIQSPSDVALFVDRVDDTNGSSTPSTSAAFGPRAVSGHHIFLTFVGGPDDRLALNLLVQLTASNPTVSATVLRVTKVEPDLETETRDTIGEIKHQQNFTVTSVAGAFPDTVYGNETTETRMSSLTADHVLWARLTEPEARAVNSRISFEEVSSPRPIHAALEHLRTQVAPKYSSSSDRDGPALIVAAGRARRLAVDSHQVELKELATALRAPSAKELRKTVGDVATAFLIAVPYQVLVFQAHATSATA